MNEKNWYMANRCYGSLDNPVGIDILDGKLNEVVCRLPDGATVHGGHAFPEQLKNAQIIVEAPAAVKVLKQLENIYETVSFIKTYKALNNTYFAECRLGATDPVIYLKASSLEHLVDKISGHIQQAGGADEKQ